MYLRFPVVLSFLCACLCWKLAAGVEVVVVLAVALLAAPPGETEQNRSTSRHVIINILLSSYEYTSDTATTTTADNQPNDSVTELLALSVSSIYATEYAQEDDDDNNKRQVASIAGEDESR